MTVMTNWSTFDDWVYHHDSIARSVKIGEQLVPIAKLTSDVVLEARATVTDDFERIARHLILRELTIVREIRVCHNF